jgi:hypothetical protein
MLAYKVLGCACSTGNQSWWPIQLPPDVETQSMLTTVGCEDGRLCGQTQRLSRSTALEMSSQPPPEHHRTRSLTSASRQGLEDVCDSIHRHRE